MNVSIQVVLQHLNYISLKLEAFKVYFYATLLRINYNVNAYHELSFFLYSANIYHIPVFWARHCFGGYCRYQNRYISVLKDFMFSWRRWACFIYARPWRTKKQDRITRAYGSGQKRGQRNFLIQYLSKCEWSKDMESISGERMIQKREKQVQRAWEVSLILPKAQQESQKPEWSECRGEWPDGGTKGHVAQEESGPFLSEMESHWMLGGRAVTASDLGPMF